MLVNKPLTPGQAIRQHCIECVGRPSEVKNCGGHQMSDGTECPLFPYRMGKGRPRVKVIRQECLRCMGGSRKFVRDCWTSHCHLYPFRMGTNPNHQPSKNKPPKRQFNGQFCSQKTRTISNNGVIAEKEKGHFLAGKMALKQR